MIIKINTAWGLLLACAPPPGGMPDGSTPGAVARYPAVPNGGGPTLGTSRLVSVTFGSDARAAALDGYLQWLAGSGWLTEAGGEYGVHDVQHASPVALTQTLPAVMTTDDVTALVNGASADAGLPQAATGEPPFVYVLFLPEGTVLVDTLGNLCRTNPGAGLHDTVGSAGARQPYVVLPFCPARFSATLTQVESTELDATRLALDTLTDPSPRDEPAYALTDRSSPWTALGTEPADFCWGRLFERDAHHLQRVWSNAAAAAGGEVCLPAPQSPAFGVAVVPAQLQTLHVAMEADFSVTGWAAQAGVDDWTLRVTPWVGDFTFTPMLDVSTLNADQAAHLSLVVPFAVPAGTYGAVLIQAIGQEDAPQWPVSFVVQ